MVGTHAVETADRGGEAGQGAAEVASRRVALLGRGPERLRVRQRRREREQAAGEARAEVPKPARRVDGVEARRCHPSGGAELGERPAVRELPG